MLCLHCNQKPFKAKFSEPGGMVIAAFVQFFVMPAVGYGLAKAFDLSIPLSIGLVLTLTAPGGKQP